MRGDEGWLSSAGLCFFLLPFPPTRILSGFAGDKGSGSYSRSSCCSRAREGGALEDCSCLSQLCSPPLHNCLSKRGESVPPLSSEVTLSRQTTAFMLIPVGSPLSLYIIVPPETRPMGAWNKCRRKYCNNGRDGLHGPVQCRVAHVVALI